MKLAAARAGLSLFGSIIFIFVFLGSYFKDLSTAEMMARLAFIGFVVAGAVFFWTWHEVVQEERKLELRERRKALNNGSDTAT